MDTIKSFKGYGKVDELEERAFRQKTRKRMIIIIVSVIVLATIVIGAVVGTLVHKNNTESNTTPSSRTNPAQSIKAVCSVTQFPDSCFSSISSVLETSNKADPEEIFKLSLQIALNELSRISSLPDKLIARSNDLRVKGALGDCKSLFDDAIDQLNSSIASMQVTTPGEKMLSSQKISDLQTWLSSAITDQETCLDGLEEMNASVFDEFKTSMKNSTEFTSNSLAIVAKILNLLDQFEIPIHRKLLGLKSDFPEWVNSKDRRLLQEPNLTPDITVAKDESGDFKTIKEAVGALKKKNTTRTVIYIKEGVYLENVVIDKTYWNIMIYGDGKTKTIVSGSLNNVDGTPTFSSATFAVTGRGFIARDMGFINTAGAAKHQAVALRSGADQSVFYRCSFDAFQDTLYAHSNRQFYRDCDIMGTIDFIFGNAAVVFQNCNIKPRQPMDNQFNTITAQGKTDANQNTGISIQKCVIVPFDNNVTAPTYLGRPWKNFSVTVIMQTDIATVVHPVGWISWIADTDPPSTIFYAEYMNTGPGSGLEKRVKWAGYKPTITAQQARKYTVDSFIQGTKWLQQTNVMFDSSL